MGYTRENILTVTGNRPLKARNQDLFIKNTSRRGLTLNLFDGEPFALDVKTQKTIDHTDLAAVSRWLFGVGIDTNGDGWADEIRTIAGNFATGCDILGISAKPANCATVEIQDFLFKCTPSQEDYSLTISLDNSKVRSQFATNRTADFVYNVRYEDLGCDGCSVEEVAEKVACLLEDKINADGRFDNPLKVPYFYNRPAPAEPQPILAHRLFTNSVDYCISFVDTECETCTNLESIAKVLVGVGEDVVETVLVNATVTTGEGENEVTTTLPAQLEGIANQITAALDGKGSAAVLKVPGACCSYRIQINTCETVVLQDAADVTIDPCATTTPFTPIATEETCKNCATEDGTVTFEAGIRVFFLAPEFPCNTSMPGVNNPPNFYGTQGYLRPNSESWKEGSYFIRKVSNMTLPEGLGYFWQIREYSQAVGGEGRNYNPYNVHKGRIGLPSKGSAALEAVKTKCHELYCSIHVSIGGVKRSRAVNDSAILQNSLNTILIPQANTTSQTSVLAFFNAAASAGNCTGLAEVSCDPEDPHVGYNKVIED